QLHNKDNPAQSGDDNVAEEAQPEEAQEAEAKPQEKAPDKGKLVGQLIALPFLRYFNYLSFNLLRRSRVKKLQAIVDQYGFNLDLSRKIYDMSVSEKQTVEIVKALYRGANILILDEPTAVLTPQEIDKLFVVLRKMREGGKSIIIITHKLNEVMAISDRVCVLRKGEHIATVETATTSEKELTDMMVGQKMDLNIDRKDPVNPKPRLIIKDMTALNKEGRLALDHVSFEVNGGEILGIAGISGNGQKELLEGIAGLQPLVEGEALFYNPKENKPVTFFHKDLKQIKRMAQEGFFHYPNGSRVDFKGISNRDIVKLVQDEQILFYEDELIDLKQKTPREIQELGIKLSFVPEDRLNMGLVGNMSIVDNMMLRSYRKGKSIFVNRKRPKKLADNIINELEVVTPSDMTPVRRLSGGNVQKVLVGREISSSPKVLMAAYPVRGLDINSSYTIYNLLNAQKEKNVAVVYVGEDLDVLLALCDRILVLCGGKVSGIVDARHITKEEIGLLMTKVPDEVQVYQYQQAPADEPQPEQEEESPEQEAKEADND
ncbi:MAG: ATP-binding cassette domain-containing protein, partial [Clostridia bacterium]|nr:ATP-binding cassette domain-containing protein [Clostridia bacterium]